MTTTVTTPILTAGTWTADAAHSDVSFTVRHMAVGKARGTFAMKSATLYVGPSRYRPGVRDRRDRRHQR